MGEVGAIGVDDLFALDRRVRELAGEVIAAAKAVDAGHDEHPFDKPSRNALSTLHTWRELHARPVSALDEPLKAGLLRWLHAFLLARVSQARRLALAEARRDHDDEGPSVATALRELVLGASDGARFAMIDVVHARSRSVCEAVDALEELVAEVGRRSVQLVGSGARATRAHGQGDARAFDHEGDAIARLLTLTEPSTGDALKQFRFDRDGVTRRPSTLAFFDGLLGRDANEGWPSRHLTTWVAETYREFLRNRRPRAIAMPTVVGAASYLRIVSAFGSSLVDAMVPAATPFAIAHDPLAMRRRVGGVTFALAMVSAPFQSRVLGLSGHEVPEQLRRLRRSVLQSARIEAARAERLRRGLRASSREAAELGAHLFEGALTEPVAALLMARGDGFDFEVFLQGVSLASAARDALDEDWFRNPRAPEWFSEHLGSAIGPYPKLADAPGAVRLLARLLGDVYA